MGGCFTCSFSCDQVVNQISQWLWDKESYIHNLEENLVALETTIVLIFAVVVAKKCHGLPLALNLIGEAMSYKRTSQEWYHAIDVMTSNAAEFPEVEDEILPILKFSYDNLKDVHVKSCLLYCALYPEDYKISKPDLIEYWICEGIIDGNRGIERAENKGYEIIGSLVRSSLLMEVDTDEAYMPWLKEVGADIVYMHDVAGVGLYGIPKFMNWSAVKRILLCTIRQMHAS